MSSPPPKSMFFGVFSPEFLFVVTFVQICFAYIFVIDEYVTRYALMFNYGSLILWGFATGSILLGAVFHRFLEKKYNPCLVFERFLFELSSYSSSKLRGLAIFLVACLIVTSLMIRQFYGELPIFLLLEESRNIADIVEDQASASLGLFGLHRVLANSLSVVLAFSLLRKYLLNINDSIPIFPLVFFISFTGMIGGKREELVIVLFLLLFLFFVIIYFRNEFASLLPFEKPIGYAVVIKVLILGILFFGLIQGITYLRLEASNEAHETNAEFFRYLSLPLLNLNYIWSYVGLEGVDFEIFKPFYLLIPAKWMDGRDSVPFVLPEATSPLGFFAIAWLYWGGVVGIIIFCMFIGFLSRLIYSRLIVSPAYVALYGFLGWDIIVSHTHNHFLTNVFLPAQALVIFLFTIFLKPRSR